jgi:predicted hydrocarbon binding protein
MLSQYFLNCEKLLVTRKSEDHVRLKPEKGEYYDVLFGEPMILLTGVSYKAFYKRLWSILSTGAITLFYEVGYELGKDVMLELKRKFRNPSRIFSVGTSHYFFIGMGSIEFNLLQLLKMAAVRSLTIKIKNSFPALAIGKTGHAECHLTRGYLVGAVDVMTGKHWTCEETKCMCKGDPYCEFKLKLATKRSG